VTQPEESDALARAEQLVAQLEADAVRVARSFVARVVEVAEDLWVEAKDKHEDGRPER
jgi:hypothetical protein